MAAAPTPAVVKTPSNQLLQAVIKLHSEYVRQGGTITLNQLKDGRRNIKKLSLLLEADSFDTHLVKVGKGWNKLDLIEQAIAHLRTPPPVKVVVAEDVNEEATPKKVKPIRPPRRRKQLQITRRSIAQQTVEPVDDGRKQIDELSHVRTALKRMLEIYSDWNTILSSEPPENTRRTLMLLLKQFAPEFIVQLSNQLDCSTNLVTNHLYTALSEILREQKGKPQANPKARRVPRDRPEHPRWKPSVARAAR